MRITNIRLLPPDKESRRGEPLVDDEVVGVVGVGVGVVVGAGVEPVVAPVVPVVPVVDVLFAIPAGIIIGTYF
jgi:hypothetical protein